MEKKKKSLLCPKYNPDKIKEAGKNEQDNLMSKC